MLRQLAARRENLDRSRHAASDFCLLRRLARAECSPAKCDNRCRPWFFAAFGFPAADPAIALLLFTLLSGSVTFWFSPLLNLNSRRFEYQADAFAAEVMGEPRSLIGALRRLNTQNLSNLVPHPLYSGFHYSHPTLLERETAVLRAFPTISVTAPAG